MGFPAPLRARASPVFSTVTQKSYFPYAAQTAKLITVDSIGTYASVASNRTPGPSLALEYAALPSSLNSGGSATLTLLQDNTVVTQVPTQQVFLVEQYHFGAS